MEAARSSESSGVNTAPGNTLVMPAPAMDREFIIKNQIVERYLAGRLPPKGVTDFERLIRARPELIEELGLADKVHAGLRLLDAAGVAKRQPRNNPERAVPRKERKARAEEAAKAAAAPKAAAPAAS